MRDFSVKFIANCKAIEGTLKKVIALTAGAATAPTFLITTNAGKVCIAGIGGDTFALLDIPAVDPCDEKFMIALPEDTPILGLLKNRNDLEFTISSNELSFKQVKGSYSGSVPMVAVTSDIQEAYNAFMNVESNAVKVPGDVMESIRAGLAATAIKDIYKGEPVISYMSIKDKKLSITAFTPQHFSSFKATVKSGISLRIALPIAHFNQIDNITASNSVNISMSNGSINAHGKGFRVSLPAIQQDAYFDTVDNFMESMGKSLYSCSVDPERFSTISENMFALYKANTTLDVTTRGAQVRFSFTGQSGSASDVMKVKYKSGEEGLLKSSVDPRLLKDIIGLVKSIKHPVFAVFNRVLCLKGQSEEGASILLACARSKEAK
jgi:hypothetical protein